MQVGNDLVAKHLCIDIDIHLQQKHKQMHLINRCYSAITSNTSVEVI